MLRINLDISAIHRATPIHITPDGQIQPPPTNPTTPGTLAFLITDTNWHHSGYNHYGGAGIQFHKYTIRVEGPPHHPKHHTYYSAYDDNLGPYYSEFETLPDFIPPHLHLGAQLHWGTINRHQIEQAIQRYCNHQEPINLTPEHNNHNSYYGDTP